MTVQKSPAPRKEKPGDGATVRTAGRTLGLKIDGERLTVPLTDLPARLDELRDRCLRAETKARVDVSGVPDMGDPRERYTALHFAHAVRDNATYRTGEQTHADLLDAVLAAARGDTAPAAANSIAAAVEVVVLAHHDALDVACERVHRTLKAKRVGVPTAARLSKMAETHKAALVRAARTATPAATFRAVLPDAPVPDAVAVPAGWEVGPAGVRRTGDHGPPPIPVPVVIAGVAKDARHGTEVVDVRWHQAGRWHSAEVRRKVIAGKADVLALADHGLLVHSGNAPDLVAYLHDYLAVNAGHLPVVTTTGQMGWVGDGGFLLGRTLVAAPAAAPASAPAVHFRGADAGQEQLADGFRAAGTLRGWREAVALAGPYPRVMLMLSAAFVPPLLHVLPPPNFVVDLAGETSTGKTTALRLAGSVYGQPFRDAGPAVVFDWNSTPVWRERSMGVLSHLPFLLDDTKTLGNPDDVRQAVYSFTQGVGRGRGSVGGTAEQVRFRGVLLSTGEQSLASLADQHGGLRPRVLGLWGPPFGAADASTLAVVRRINQVVAEHHGQAGRAFVQALLGDPDLVAACRRFYDACHAFYQDRAGANPVAARMAAPVAAVVTASWAAHEALGLPGEWADPIDPLYAELTAAAAEADRAAAAARHAVSWAFANMAQFYDHSARDAKPPQGRWAGRWDRGGPGVADPTATAKYTWPVIGFLPHTLKEVLEAGGFAYEATVATWHDRGWLKTNDKRMQAKTRLGSETVNMIALTREAAERVGAV